MMLQTWESLKYRQFMDQKVGSAAIRVRTSRTRRADKYLKVAESKLRRKAHRLLPGTTIGNVQGRLATSHLRGSAGRCGGGMRQQQDGDSKEHGLDGKVHCNKISPSLHLLSYCWHHDWVLKALTERVAKVTTQARVINSQNWWKCTWAGSWSFQPSCPSNWWWWNSQCSGKSQWTSPTRSAPSTRSLWKSAEGKVGKLAVSLWRWAAKNFQSIHSAKHFYYWTSPANAPGKAKRKALAQEGRSVDEHCWDLTDPICVRVSNVERPEASDDPKIRHWWCVLVYLRYVSFIINLALCLSAFLRYSLMYCM